MKKTLVWLQSVSFLITGCAKPNISAKTIKIGLQIPLIVVFAAGGQWDKQCVEVAADLINKKDGVLGKIIEIVIADDTSSPKDSALAAQKPDLSGTK